MLNLNFSAAIPNTIEDQNGEGTGFTSVEPNKNGDQYDRSRINLDKTAGNLVLTATQGSSATANTLKNALQVAFNGTKTFTVSTRLTAPLNFSTAFQQGGIFVGSNQNNYVKLVLVNSSQGNNGLKVQFYREEKGIGGGSSVGEIRNLDWSNIKTLDLFLTGSPFANKISAAYRVNSDSAAPTILTQKFTPNQSASFFGDASKNRAGIIASTTNAPDVAVKFDNFGIAQDVKINFQPSNAPLPTGYIKDSGQAYSASRGFGWVTQASLSSNQLAPLNISPYSRDRNRPGVDQRIDTLLHMQYPNTTPAAWEYALPNGTYAVTVSVGDKPNDQGVYDSKNTVRVEGITAINQFQSTPKQQYQLATVKVNVTDGKLTVDAIGGVNTKLNYLEINNITPGKHPSVTGTSISRDATGVYRDAAVNVDVALPTVGAGVDQKTLNTTNVKLYRTIDGASVPGIVGTSGGGDAIVYQPSGKLAPNTNYTFQVTSNVRDESGAKFIPFSRTFNTGTDSSVPDAAAVKFNKSTVFTGAPIASLTIGPDNKLYAAGLDGSLRRWTIDATSGTLSNLQTFAPPSLAGRAIIGIAFDPKNPNNLWITDNAPLFPQPAKDFTGKITKLTLNPNSPTFNPTVQDYVVDLPRSAKDHLTNSLAFGPDGKLYVTQGSNSAMGAPDAAWANRKEHLLNATILQIDPNRTPPAGGFNVRTENNPSGNYNPFAPDAPVKIYATGVRNAYDLVWHTNGNLYTAANGSAANGNTPDDPRTPTNEGLTKVATQNDYLFKIQPGGYYGHPNPLRQEYIMNGANPTSGVDPAEVVTEVDPSTGKVYNGYPVGTKPDPNYRGFAYNFGRNRSPNGTIEYQSNNFNGALKNKLLVVEYSGGDDILALAPGADGNIPRGNVTQVVSGLSDPLDLVEDTRKNAGNLYVAELIGGGTSGKISLLKAS